MCMSIVMALCREAYVTKADARDWAPNPFHAFSIRIETKTVANIHHPKVACQPPNRPNR